MKRLAISTGAVLGVVLVGMSLARGQQRNLMPPAPAVPAGPEGVADFLQVGRPYYYEAGATPAKGNNGIPYSVRVLAKPDGGWVKVEDQGDNGQVRLVNLNYILTIKPR